MHLLRRGCKVHSADVSAVDRGILACWAKPEASAAGGNGVRPVCQSGEGVIAGAVSGGCGSSRSAQRDCCPTPISGRSDCPRDSIRLRCSRRIGFSTDTPSATADEGGRNKNASQRKRPAPAVSRLPKMRSHLDSLLVPCGRHHRYLQTLVLATDYNHRKPGDTDWKSNLGTGIDTVRKDYQNLLFFIQA